MKHQNKILTHIFLGIALSAILMNSAKAVGEMLDIRIHKNDITGDIWTNEAEKIQVSAKQNNSTLEIGKGKIELGLDASKGGLKFKEKKTCSFNISDQSGGKIEKNFEYEVYEQLSAGQFLVPPERIATERFVIDGTAAPFTCPTSDPLTQADYDVFVNEWNAFREMNPFTDYPDTLRLFPTGGNIQVSIEKSGDDIKIFKKDTSGGYTDETLSSFACKKGSISGICEKITFLNAGEKKILDLAIVPISSGVIERPDPITLTPGDDAHFSESVTLIGNFLIRTTSLLDWSLQISESGFQNEQIAGIFRIFLNVTNGFFVIALLIIALLWNFSALLPRDVLKKMIALFALATISVNLALPLTRLAVDGTNILQKSFLTRRADEAIEAERKIRSGENITPDIEEDLQKKSTITARDILSAYDLDYGGFVGVQKSAYEEKGFPQNLGATVDPEKLSGLSDKYIDRMKERTLMNLILVGMTAIAQLTIACLFLFRNIILWFLLIFSPFLFILFLFSATRWVFRYWVYLYFRWLLIGPLLAMCLFITVNIWTSAGIPIESGYAPPASLNFPNTTNLFLSAPGITSGYLNTPRELMKYIAALMMLFISTILPFWLTRVLPGGGKGSDFFIKLRNKNMSDIKARNISPSGGTNNPFLNPTDIGSNIREITNRGDIMIALSPEIKNETQKENPIEMLKNFGKNETPDKPISQPIKTENPTDSPRETPPQPQKIWHFEEQSQKKSSQLKNENFSLKKQTTIGEERDFYPEEKKLREKINQEDQDIFLGMPTKTENNKDISFEEKEGYDSEILVELEENKNTPERNEKSLEERTSRFESRFGQSEKSESIKEFHEKKEIIRENLNPEEKGKQNAENKKELDRILNKKNDSKEKEKTPLLEKNIAQMRTQEITKRFEEIRNNRSPIAGIEKERLEKELRNRAENGDQIAEKAVQEYWEKTAEKSDLESILRSESARDDSSFMPEKREANDLVSSLNTNIIMTSSDQREIIEKTSAASESQMDNFHIDRDLDEILEESDFPKIGTIKMQEAYFIPEENSQMRTSFSEEKKETPEWSKEEQLEGILTTGNEKENTESTSGESQQSNNQIENAEFSIAHAEISLSEKEEKSSFEGTRHNSESDIEKNKLREWAEEEIIDQNREEIFDDMFSKMENSEIFSLSAKTPEVTKVLEKEKKEEDSLLGKIFGDVTSQDIQENSIEISNGKEWDEFRDDHAKLNKEITEENPKEEQKENPSVDPTASDKKIKED